MYIGDRGRFPLRLELLGFASHHGTVGSGRSPFASYSYGVCSNGRSEGILLDAPWQIWKGNVNSAGKRVKREGMWALASGPARSERSWGDLTVGSRPSDWWIWLR